LRVIGAKEGKFLKFFVVIPRQLMIKENIEYETRGTLKSPSQD